MKPHKSRWVASRCHDNRIQVHATYHVCGCDYGQDHDDNRSIMGQDMRIIITPTGPVNDMLHIARRETWNFSPKELKYLKSWLFSAGDYDEKAKKLGPVPFADEIWRLVSKLEQSNDKKG